MSCLNLRLVLPPTTTKVWRRVFTNKLHFKFSKSKALKKRKIKSRGFWWPKKRKINNRRNTRKTQHCCLQNGPLPVFVDHLFVEPKSVANQQVFEKMSGSSSELKNDEKSHCLEMERNGFKNDENTSAADDVWESLVLGSPQMDGIDQRAEEFIARFRADMQHQELMSRHS